MPESKPALPTKSKSDLGRKLWKPGRSTRMKAGLVGLSSAAVLSVYAAGYINTRADATTNLAVAAPVISAAPAATPTTATAPTRAAGGSTVQAQPTARATATPTTAAASVSYKDGSYVGVGNSRHGSIQATVVIQGGKIVSAEITQCGTRYPCSKVSNLPAQVIARQSAQVNHVSGATDSSNAYMGAVASALAQAKA